MFTDIKIGILLYAYNVKQSGIYRLDHMVRCSIGLENIQVFSRLAYHLPYYLILYTYGFQYFSAPILGRPHISCCRLP